MTIDMRLGDCLDVIATLPDACVDAIVTDPPYQQTSLEWDRWVDGWPGAVARVLKPGGSMWVFGTLRMFVDRRDEFADWRLAQDIIWEKHNGSSMRTDRFRRVHEQAAQFYRGEWSAVYKGRVVTMDARKRTVTRTLSPAHLGRTGASTFESEEGGPRIMRSVIYARSQHGVAIHKTQKPEAIIEPLIRPCRHVGGSLAIWAPHKPGEGRPIFAKPHMVRQRKSIAEMRCTVCGERTEYPDRWWFPRGNWQDGWWMSTEAPVHLACADLARHACPVLRRAGDDPIRFPPGSTVLSAIVGGHATDEDFGVRIGGRRVVGHLKLAWRRPRFLSPNRSDT